MLLHLAYCQRGYNFLSCVPFVMSVDISVRDYRVVREADVSLSPGIHLVVADNNSGKSTLLKAVRTLLDGTMGESINPRHGSSGFSIKLSVDGSSVEAVRQGKSTSVSVDGGAPVSKLGKKTLSQLVPDFPLRRIDTETSSFYPNFCFQNSVPLFREVSVLDLFGSMFRDVSKLSDCVDSAKSRVSDCQKAVDSASLVRDAASSDLSDVESSLRSHQESCPATSLTSEVVSEWLFHSRSLAPGMKERLDLLASRPDHLALVKPYRTVKAMLSLVERASPKDEEDIPPLVDVHLFELVHRLDSSSRAVADTKPGVDPLEQRLFELMSRYVSAVVSVQSVLLELRSAEESLDNLRSRHGDVLLRSGCPALSTGSCPLVGLEVSSWKS